MIVLLGEEAKKAAEKGEKDAIEKELVLTKVNKKLMTRKFTSLSQW